MSRSAVVNQIVRVVSDGTGRSPDEVRTIAAAGAVVVVSVAAVRALIWIFDRATNVDVRLLPARRS